MTFATTDRSLARQLDAQDELASFRDEFVFADPDVIYLDGNSLGRLPKATPQLMRDVIEQEWGERLIRAWNEGWIDTPTDLGARIARLVGAQPEEVLLTDATSINLFKAGVAALRAQPDRVKVVSDVLNFPSDLYILQGIIELLGGTHRLELIPSADQIHIETDDVEAVIDATTALVCLTHVAFKSAFMYDLERVTQHAHEVGALVLWDLSHSVGAVPLNLNAAQVDLAVGCTYKYLNGGPGAPAFIYVRRDLQPRLVQPIWGWFASANPFAFELEFTPAEDISRFRVGTQPVLSMMALDPALEIIQRAGIDRIRTKSLAQTEYLIYLADEWLASSEFRLGSPRRGEVRGSHVSLQHPEAYRINRALIESPSSAVTVIPDFREPDNIRMGINPLYNSFSEIHQALQRLRTIADTKEYDRFPQSRLKVT